MIKKIKIIFSIKIFYFFEPNIPFFRDISSKSALKSISSKYKSSDFSVLNGIDVKSNYDESIEDITLPIINIGNTNFTSIDQLENGSTIDADDDDVVIPRRQRRQINNTPATSGTANEDLFLQLDSISDSLSSSGSDFTFEAGLTSAKKTSARYGRRSQLNMLSQITMSNCDISTVNGLNEDESRHENSKHRINLEEELLQALQKFDINSENASAKNSARYGRRASNTDGFDGLTRRNIQNERIFDTDTTLDPITIISQSRKNSHASKQKNIDLNLEESWKSLRAFNKKHKGRISESKRTRFEKF